MSKKLKIIISVAISLIIIAGVAFFTYPQSFKNNSTCEYITGVYIKQVIKSGGEPDNDIKEFKFSSETDEFKKISDILKKYSYHNCLDTLIKGAEFKDQSESIQLYFDNHMIILSDVSKVIIDNHTYQIGYFGNSKSIELINELKIILGVE